MENRSIASYALNSRIANKASNLILVPFWPVGRVIKAIHTARRGTWSVPVTDEPSRVSGFGESWSSAGGIPGV